MNLEHSRFIRGDPVSHSSVRSAYMKPLLSAVLLALVSPSALAHVIQVPYTLPVPFWLYAYGATGALLASFVVVGYFVNVNDAPLTQGSVDITAVGVFRTIAHPRFIATMRGVSVGLLLLTIATGFVGPNYSTTNFNMTFFWIVFVLGFAYFSAIVGDTFKVLNPWLVLCEVGERINRCAFQGRVRYPPWLAYYPALVLYAAFIWLELFGKTTPVTLSIALVVYSVLNMSLAYLFGKQVWFRYGEFLSVFFRMIGKQAPLDFRYKAGAPPRLEIRGRPPFLGLLEKPAESVSLLIFVLFMLSSTAFDGIHDTVPWVAVFWKLVYPGLERIVATGSPRQYLVLVDFYYYWQWTMLLASPLFYLAIYAMFIWLAKVITKSSLSVTQLALRFAFSLIPIAFVYNVTHYFTLLVSQGPFIVPMLSDPFGFGWNMLGTKLWYTQPFLLDAGTVWHVQVGLILFGHIVSVYLSHLEALTVFKGRRAATLSQVPLLLLMVLLTTIGLWILSLPIAAGQIMLPPPPPAN